ncbi:NeuD/PglB/VioB family sugar acetyltransferase [Microvirga aerophila]|uniref:NeuD/PglB/VioB family sugar acetyltransferase n=1 Tax=Microvirga aerophila TaxID=670291 RepID=UPI000DEEF777
MSGTPLVLYGAGSQAYVLDEIVTSSGFQVEAILNDTEVPAGFALGVKVIEGRAAIDEWLKNASVGLHYAISIGAHHGEARSERHRLLRRSGLQPATLVHRTAWISKGAQIGEACQILAFAFVGTRARLGDAVILNTRASIDHECILGHGVHVGPSATVAGRVGIGDHTFIGTGASVCPDVTISANCIIGAGTVVTRSIHEPGTYVGSPARRIG